MVPWTAVDGVNVTELGIAENTCVLDKLTPPVVENTLKRPMFNAVILYETLVVVAGSVGEILDKLLPFYVLFTLTKVKAVTFELAPLSLFVEVIFKLILLSDGIPYVDPTLRNISPLV